MVGTGRWAGGQVIFYAIHTPYKLFKKITTRERWFFPARRKGGISNKQAQELEELPIKVAILPRYYKLFSLEKFSLGLELLGEARNSWDGDNPFFICATTTTEPPCTTHSTNKQ